MLNFLHVSDLHFTAQETGLRSDYGRGAVNAILRLIDDLKSKGVLGDPLYLAITGDLVQSGSNPEVGAKSDFDAVQEYFLEPLLERSGISPRNVFMIPGNHEMDRSAIDEEDYLVFGQRISQSNIADDLAQKLENFYSFVEKHGYNSVTREQPRLKTFSIGDQQIVCFNGLAGSYSRQGLGDKGHLFVLPTEMAGALGEISDRAVVLTHHPLSWFFDDCEMTLRNFFASKRCRILTGHIHNEGISENGNGSGSFVTIQAGATSEVGDSQFVVGLAWLPESNSAAVRHFRFNVDEARFPIAGVETTRVAPAIIYFT